MVFISFLFLFLRISMAASDGRKASTRRFSMAKSNSISHSFPENEESLNDMYSHSHQSRRMSWKRNPEIFGSVISLADDEGTS